MLQFLRTSVLAASCLMALAAVAATAYRWVDDQGQVHYSDAVPAQYRSKAKPVNLPNAEPTAEQQDEALQRAEAEKAKALARSISPSSSPKIAQPASSASAPSRKHPVQIPTEKTDCKTWQRLYMESIQCFGPYRTVRGGVKPEAFEACNVVAEPPPTRCRMQVP